MTPVQTTDTQALYTRKGALPAPACGGLSCLWRWTRQSWRSRAGWRVAACVFVMSVAAQAVLVSLVLEVPEGLKALTRMAVLVLAFSGLVTSFATMALERWVLKPLYFLRDELLRTAHDPEEPRLRPSPHSAHDEIGQAIVVAQKLIAQNAQNLRRVKNAAEGQIHRLAYYDALTNLPNRTLFLKALEEQARARLERNSGRAAECLAVITLDLDHFRDLNDSMGHEVGDAVLRGMARRLRSILPPAAMIARTGEDEFAVMVGLDEPEARAQDVADRVSVAIRSTPFTVLGEDFQVRASIGVTAFPEDGVRPEQILKNADIALNHAKEAGRDTVRAYSQDFDDAVQGRFQMLRDLRTALENDELALHFQPQISLADNAITGAEALIRWWKPDGAPGGGGSFVPPNMFIPVAENSGLILPIGEWVLYRACRAAADWQRLHNLPLRVAVNVSAAQFMQSDLCAVVRGALEASGLAPKHLELEVTESLFMEEVKYTVGVLNCLHDMGVELAIDDFGTGYSSLSYLRQFPIDRLKIDRSFIKDALIDPDSAAIARTIVKLGHSLGLHVVAEGVETPEQEEFLRTQGCDSVQGFYYCRPIPDGDFVSFVRAHGAEQMRKGFSVV